MHCDLQDRGLIWNRRLRTMVPWPALRSATMAGQNGVVAVLGWFDLQDSTQQPGEARLCPTSRRVASFQSSPSYPAPPPPIGLVRRAVARISRRRHAPSVLNRAGSIKRRCMTLRLCTLQRRMGLATLSFARTPWHTRRRTGRAGIVFQRAMRSIRITTHSPESSIPRFQSNGCSAS